MKRNTITIQINYNNIILYLNNEYKTYEFKSISNYKITNKISFKKELKEFLELNKIKNKL